MTEHPMSVKSEARRACAPTCLSNVVACWTAWARASSLSWLEAPDNLRCHSLDKVVTTVAFLSP